MSKAGNYTAYQQYKPQDNGTIQAIQHWSNFAEQKRQNDINNEQKEKEFEYKVEKDKEKKRDEWLQYDSVPATGVKNLDVFKSNSLNLGQKELFKSVEEYEKLPNGDPRKLQLEFKIARLQKLPSDFKNLTTPTLKIAQDYYANPNKWVRDPAIDDFLKNLDNAEFTINDAGESAVVVKDTKDPSKTKIITLEEAMSDGGIAQLTPKLNWDTLIEDNYTYLNKKTPTQKPEYDPATNTWKTEQGWTKESIDDISKNLFIDKEGKPTPTAISFLKQKGIYDKEKLEDPVELEKLSFQFSNDLNPYLTYKKGEKWDKDKKMYEVAKFRANAQIQYNNARTDIAKQKALSGNSVIPDNPDIDFITKSNKLGVNINENKFVIMNNNEDVIIEQQIREINIDPNKPGRIIVKGTIIEETPGDFSGKKPTKTEYSYDSSNASGLSQVEKVAAQLNMNAQQFYDYIKSRMPKQPKPTAEKPTVQGGKVR